MKLKYYDSIENDPDKLGDAYYTLIKQTQTAICEYKTENLKESEIKKKAAVFQEIYDKLSELQYLLSPIKQEKGIKIKNYDGLEIDIEHFNEVSKDWLNRIHLRYLYPLILKLSEFSEKKAKHRDYLLFGLSIVISTVLSLVVTYYFELKNDKDLKIIYFDLKGNQSKIIQQNDSIIKIRLNKKRDLDSIN